MNIDITQLSNDELVALCQRYVEQQREQHCEPEWTGHLVVTPREVTRIIEANEIADSTEE